MVHMNGRTFRALAAAAAACVVLSSCGGGGKDTGGSAGSPAAPADVTGSITVLTNRTDLNQDGTLKKYAAAFNEVYPKVQVSFQAITDY
jgi:raffinose/stachyose/melibiose transport system substrate-binding protein